MFEESRTTEKSLGVANIYPDQELAICICQLALKCYA